MGSIEANHKPVEVARKSQEVCIKIEGAPGEAPKMVGRHFDEQDVLTSKVRKSRFGTVLNSTVHFPVVRRMSATTRSLLNQTFAEAT